LIFLVNLCDKHFTFIILYLMVFFKYSYIFILIVNLQYLFLNLLKQYTVNALIEACVLLFFDPFVGCYSIRDRAT